MQPAWGRCRWLIGSAAWNCGTPPRSLTWFVWSGSCREFADLIPSEFRSSCERACGTTKLCTVETSNVMTILSLPAISADGLSSGRNDPAIGGDGVRMRAQCRHLATVVTISGDVDAANGGRVQDFATRFVLVGNALVLDLGGVDFFSARGISVLIAVDDACRIAEVPWALIPSRVVSRVLHVTDCDAAVPSASSVPEALRQLTAATHARRRLALVITTTAQRHAV
jgi:anti-anti-sigma factor